MLHETQVSFTSSNRLLKFKTNHACVVCTPFLWQGDTNVMWMRAICFAILWASVQQSLFISGLSASGWPIGPCRLSQGLSGPPVCCCWNADRGLSALERPIWSLSRMVSKASELECEINDLICRLNLVSTSTMFYVTPLGQFCCH